MPSNIHIKDRTKLQQKIGQFKKDGPQSLHVVSDFDKTLSKAFIDGKKVLSTYAILREKKYLTPDYQKRAFALFDEYHPIEVADDIPQKEKNKKMQEWWFKHFNLMKECGMNKGVIQDVVRRRLVRLREGTLAFLDILAEHGIPLLIFSAGIGDVIEEFLRNEKRLHDNTYIISNFYQFDELGKVKGCKKDFIHVFNKNEVEVKKTPYYKEISTRKNVILLGDSLGDLGMTEGFAYDEIIRVGFLNDNQERFFDKYADAFDMVILDDGSMEYVNELLKEIVG